MEGNLFRKKALLVIVAFCVFAAAAILLRPPSIATGLPEDEFWERKYTWPARYDVMIAGCSRINQSLSPSEMSRVLVGYRVGNFGFTGLGYSKRYLSAVHDHLDSSSKKRIIVLGASAHNFRQPESHMNGFIELANEHPAKRWLKLHVGAVRRVFKPYDFLDYDRSKHLGVRFCPDGWVAVREQLPNPEACVPVFRQHYREERVCPEIEDLVIKTVERWTRSGIAVFGIRVPTTSKMRSMEDSYSGFSEHAFASRFQQAGGIWLSFPVGDYESYDGSHLTEHSARKLSRKVAEAISCSMAVAKPSEPRAGR